MGPPQVDVFKKNSFFWIHSSNPKNTKVMNQWSISNINKIKILLCLIWIIIFVYKGESSVTPCIPQAVVVVGHGSINNEDHWLIKNSFGPNWGIGGYMFMLRNSRQSNNGTCMILLKPMYPIIKSSKQKKRWQSNIEKLVQKK
jgi:hypothetical protein